MKRAIIKGFADRARALCDEKHRAEELHNIEDVFVANGYTRETVRRFMEQRPQQIDKREQEERESRGVVTIPYLKGLSEQFRRTANRHSFRVAFKPGRKIKDIKRTCQEPLGERRQCVVYKIPCACQNTVYVGETYLTWRLFQTRKKEHMDKVRLTIEDLHKGNTLSAEKRMGKEDGGLARHTTECQSDVDWGNAEIVARERGLKQRKILEGIESLRQRYYEMRVLNNFDHVDTWKAILNSSLIVKETARDDELSQNVKVLGRPAFPAHFYIVYPSCNDHDTPCAVTKLNVTTKRSAILITF